MSTNIKKRLGLLLSLGMMLLLPVHGAESAAVKLEKPNLKVGLSAFAVAYLPFYVAVEENLFKNEGLNVEVLSFRSGTDDTQALISRSVDLISTGFPDLLTSRIRGIDLKMFYGGCNNPVYEWRSKPEIKSIREAKGRKFGVSRMGAQTHLLTVWAVRKAGLDPEKDIQIVQCGNPMECMSALVAGGVDVTILSEPGSSIAGKQGYPALLKLNQFVKGFPLEVYIAHTDFIKSYPETLKALLRAQNKGIEIAMANQDKALAAIKKYIKVTGEDALLAYQSYRETFPIDGMPPLDGIDLVQEMAIESGEMKVKLPLTDLIDYTYINLFKK